MIGYKCIVETRIKIFESAESYTGSSSLRQHLQKRKHNLSLKVIFIVDFQQLTDQNRHIILRHGIIHGMEKARLFYQPAHLFMKHRVIMRSDVAEI
ncbi:hypothetical protein IMSAG025_01025 [Muribaculaceae bacterium]|nr:hypothetical protein IMSAG025_01025 [Muribaculaceae bacterium]